MPEAIGGERALTGPEKAAALLLMMGRPPAARLLKQFDQPDLQALARAAAGLGGWIRKDVAGYDIKDLMVGSEGTPGIVTAVRLRLLPARGRTRLRPWLWLLPGFALLAVYLLYPAITTAINSLQDATSNRWVGLANYHNLFTNKFFYNALRNTVTIGVISTVPQLCLALGIAHLLNYKLRARTFFRVAMLMPYATSLAAAASTAVASLPSTLSPATPRLAARASTPGPAVKLGVAVKAATPLSSQTKSTGRR